MSHDAIYGQPAPPNFFMKYKRSDEVPLVDSSTFDPIDKVKSANIVMEATSIMSMATSSVRTLGNFDDCSELAGRGQICRDGDKLIGFQYHVFRGFSSRQLINQYNNQ